MIRNRLRIGLTLSLMLGVIALFVARGEMIIAEESTLIISASEMVNDADDTDMSTVFLPLISKRFDPTVGIPPFGVQMYGSLNASTGITYAVDAGASWVRVPISWGAIEPTDVSPDQYNWVHADARILDPALRGLNLLVTIDHAPDWAATYPSGPIDKVDIGEFAEFVGALVERYDGDGLDDAPGSPVVNNWEFYNEPDAGDEYRAIGGFGAYWGPFGGEYAAMLKAVYPVIKAANPDANVVFGGIAYEWFEEDGGPFVERFLDDVLSAGGGEYFDIMNIHAYTNNFGVQGPGLLEKVEYVREKVQSYGVDKPMIVTETGKHSDNRPHSPSSPELQARYVVVLFTQGMASDCQIVIWWMLKEPGSFYWDNGLVDYDLSPKPSYYAYQTMTSKLETAHFERALTPVETGSDDLVAYKFIDNVHAKTIYIAWLYPVEESDRSRPLWLPASRAVVSDIYGDEVTVSDGDDGVRDGRITVPVNGQPVYVEVNW